MILPIIFMDENSSSVPSDDDTRFYGSRQSGCSQANKWVTYIKHITIHPPTCHKVKYLNCTHAHLPGQLRWQPPNKNKIERSPSNCYTNSTHCTPFTQLGRRATVPLWAMLSIQYMIPLKDFITGLFVIVNAVLPRFGFCSLANASPASSSTHFIHLTARSCRRPSSLLVASTPLLLN